MQPLCITKEIERNSEGQATTNAPVGPCLCDHCFSQLACKNVMASQGVDDR